MTFGEAIFVRALGALFALIANRGQRPPILSFSYGKSGNNDLVRMHYHREGGAAVPYPWIIREVRAIWPFGRALFVSDAEAIQRPKVDRVRRSLSLKPGKGTLFLGLHSNDEFPPSILLLLRVERAVPTERRWVVSRVLRPIRFDLRHSMNPQP